ncbi:hypothetical protein GGI07_005239, partial [Coemansia sp. Benny D115]
SQLAAWKHCNPGQPRLHGRAVEVSRGRPRQGVHGRPRVHAQGGPRNEKRVVASQNGQQPGGKECALLPVGRAARKHRDVPGNRPRYALGARRCAEKMLASPL